MHLKRIRVPDFRVLKDVDISFEENFSPRIFPLGSQNGGGKSTLLQLIFVLLHCAFVSERQPALKHLLKGFSLDSTARKPLAIVNVVHEDQEIEVEFFGCTNSYIEELLAEDSLNTATSDESAATKRLKFSLIPALESAKRSLSKLLDEQSELEKLISAFEYISYLDPDEQRSQLEELSQLGKLHQFSSHGRHYDELTSEMRPLQVLQQEARLKLDGVKNSYKRLSAEISILSVDANSLIDYLNTKNLIFICDYLSTSSSQESQVFICCQIRYLEMSQVFSFLKRLSNNVFLAAPSTQVFLFLPQELNKLLFKKRRGIVNSDNYHLQLKEAEVKMPGLFTYDFLSVDLLIDAFKSAGEQDFKEAIETGTYGNAYQTLLNDLNKLLINKKANISSDFSEITFQLSENDEITKLYPEDLSHGELKRLSIYMWLKYRNIKDAIVLMDEIEIALHPDWQYGIVSDLMQWSPTNQYILATHSYELCQALTPAHVKELEPKLLRQTEQSV